MKLQKLQIIGEPIDDSTIVFDSVIGKANEKNVLYTTTKGIIPVFYGIDLDTMKIIYNAPLIGGGDVWSHTIVPNGNVYIASNNQLWEYNSSIKRMRKVFEYQTESIFWTITHDPDGNIYIGTFPGGRVLKYQPNSNEVDDFGKVNENLNEEYIRSVVYHDNHIYAGTGSAQLYKINITTKTKVNIAECLYEKGFVYDLDLVDNRYLFTRFSVSKKRYIYDLNEKKWLNRIINNSEKGLCIPCHTINGYVHLPMDGIIMLFDIENDSFTPTKMDYKAPFRNAHIVQMNSSKYPGDTVVKIDFSGNIHLFNHETQEAFIYNDILPKNAAITHRIGKGPNGEVFISAMQSTKAAMYIPDEEEFYTFPMGQAGTLLPYKDQMYFGVYPGAKLFAYDPNLPISEHNPTLLFSAGKAQDRFIYGTTGNKKLYLPTMPDYGELGGALVVFDPHCIHKEKAFQTHRHIVHNQSVISVAYQNGLVYGSTSIMGGIGTEPTEEEAKIFIWDTTKDKILKDFTLTLPGLNKPKAIGGLQFGNDGLLWGGVEGFVFALHPETHQVEKYIDIFPEGNDWAEWGSANSQIVEDIFYINLGQHLVAVNIKSMEFLHIANSDAFVVDDNGGLYFSPHHTNSFPQAERTKLFYTKVL